MISKSWAIKLATEAARTVLSVDQIIVARQAGGPKPPGPNPVRQFPSSSARFVADMTWFRTGMKTRWLYKRYRVMIDVKYQSWINQKLIQFLWQRAYPVWGLKMDDQLKKGQEQSRIQVRCKIMPRWLGIFPTNTSNACLVVIIELLEWASLPESS